MSGSLLERLNSVHTRFEGIILPFNSTTLFNSVTILNRHELMSLCRVMLPSRDVKTQRAYKNFQSSSTGAGLMFAEFGSIIILAY